MVEICDCFSQPRWDPFPREYSPWRRGGVAGTEMGRGRVHTSNWSNWEPVLLLPEAILELEVRDGSPASLRDNRDVLGRIKNPREGCKCSQNWRMLRRQGQNSQIFLFQGQSGCYPQSFPSHRISRSSRGPSRRCCRRSNQHQHMEGSSCCASVRGNHCSASRQEGCLTAYYQPE